MAKELTTLPEINLASCTSLEEVQDALSLMAKDANKSLAHALKAQIQVVKYISKPDLYGSTFDLFFKNLKKAIDYSEDEESAYDLREQAALMLNNFVFFMKAKIEWEVSVNRKEGEALFMEASHGLAESVLTLSTMYYDGATKLALKATAVKHLSNLFFNPDKENDNWFKKAGRWLFKSSRTKEKELEFCDTLDRLADKLVDQYDVIGKNDLIAGIYENYYEDLMDYHSPAWTSYWSEADEYLNKSWQIPIYEIVILGVLSGIVWLIRWIISWFSNTTPGWGVQHWMWTGICTGIIAFGTASVCLICYFVKKSKGNKSYKSISEYYTSLINLFRE